MDLTQLAENLGFELDEFIEVAELFVETSLEDLAMLRRAIAGGDADQVSKAAHSIKGAAGNLGFMDIYETAQRIDQRARKQVLDGAEEGVASIAAKLEQVQRAIERA